jgi:hypothetical protein
VADRPPSVGGAGASWLGADVNAAERASALVVGWAAMYTRRLPRELARARCDELVSDLWEQRADAAEHGGSPVGTAAAIVWRMLAGIPADLVWRHQQGRVAARRPQRQRIDGRWVMVGDRTLLTRARMRVTTRRCKACGERYRRRYPYCPVCKTRKGRHGALRDPSPADPIGRGF